jgi:SPP1 gp7 family putative phage head morphogenesis protein
VTPAAAGQYLEGLERFLAGTVARQLYGDHVCMAAQPQTPNGSPDDLVEHGVAAGAAVAQRWADTIVRALEHTTTEHAIRQMLMALPAILTLQPFADVAHGSVLSGCMLGALDSHWEREHGVELAPVRFDAREDAAQVAHGNIARLWNERKVLPRQAFDALDAGARRRAFTVAGLARGELLTDVHAELGRQLAAGARDKEGPNLRDFSQFVDKRLKSAGWTPANPSHVETIFRTNVQSAYSSGRFAEMRQPAVMAAMPYWQIRTVKDSRQRATHRAADGRLLPADHPFWAHAYPPFGYNCRCRVCARSAAWVKATNATIGPPPTGLPDPGFESGTRTLIQVPHTPVAAPPQQPTVRPPPPRDAVPTVPAPPPPFEPGPFPVPPGWPASPRPAPPPDPGREEFEQAGISIGGGGGLEAVHKRAQLVFGQQLTPQFVHDLVGAEQPMAKLGVKGRYRIQPSPFDADQIEVTGIFGKSHIVREYQRNKRGELIVHHAYFKVEDAHQAAGLGKRILANQVDQYEKLGVAKIKTEAAWVGQYTWPRMGFTLREEAELEPLKKAFATFAREAYDLTEEDAAVMADVTSIHQLAMVQLPPMHGFAPDALKAGKRFLLARGKTEAPLIELQVRRNGPEYAQLRRYLGLPQVGRR